MTLCLFLHWMGAKECLNSAVDKLAVHTGPELLRTNFALYSDEIVPLTSFPFSCSNGNGMERLRIVPLFVALFSRSISCNGVVLFEAFPSECNPSAFHFLEQCGTNWNDWVSV